MATTTCTYQSVLCFCKIRSVILIVISSKMSPIFPISAVLTEAMPDYPLPVEIWVIILRKLDPKALLVAVKTYPHWLNIARGDSVLRRTIRKQMKMEERTRQQEIANLNLLVEVTRSVPLPASFNSNSTNTKTVRRRSRTVLTAPELVPEFRLKKNSNGPGPIRREKLVRPAPYRSMRC